MFVEALRFPFKHEAVHRVVMVDDARGMAKVPLNVMVLRMWL